MPNDKDNHPKPPLSKIEPKADKDKKGLLESLNLSQRYKSVSQFATRYKIPIIALFVGGLLGITAIRMLHYASPSMNDEKYQEDLSKFKTVHIDKKTVNRINQLQDSQVAPSTNITNRSNPFSE